ncbi:hypothetical protein COBT_000735 [Conglomerata obtusa]
MAEEEEIVTAQKPQDLNKIPDINESDKAIMINLGIQLIIAIGSIILLLSVRRRLLWLYSPNTKNKKNHPASLNTNTRFSWISPIFAINDVTLISIIGLDSFMMLQTLKLLYRIFFIIGLLSVPLLLYYFYGSKNVFEEQIFVRLSIQNVDRHRTYYVPLLFVYIITFFIFYMIYVYYKKFISLRQAYIRSPAILSPLSNLKRMSISHDNYLEMINIASKSVVLFRIPNFIDTDEELRVFVEALGCGTIENCVLVQDTRGLEQLTDERDCLVRDIEREIERMYRNIYEEIVKRSENDLEFKNIIEEIESIDILREQEKIDEFLKNNGKGDDNGKDDDKDKSKNESKNENNSNNINSNNINTNNTNNNQPNNSNNNQPNTTNNNQPNNSNNVNNNMMSEREITVLARKLLYSKNKYIKRYKNIDSLTYKMKKLEKVQNNLSEEIIKLNNKPEKHKPEEEIINLMNENNFMYTRMNFDEDISFFSFRQILHFQKNAHLFTLDLPVYTRTAFITFTEPKAAQLLAQCLISSKVFSCQAHPAPAPNDVIWENINRGEVITYLKTIVGTLIFIGLNLIFYTLVFGLSSLIQLERLEQAFPAITVITQYSFIRSSFNGFVTPLIFNMLLATAPFILTIITYYEGVYSYSGLYLRLMERYGIFLVFNGFLALLFSSTFYGMIIDFARGQAVFADFAKEFAKGLITLSVFFTNAIIQRMIMGNVIVALKPVKLFLEWFADGICKTFGTVRPRRSRVEAQSPESANFGIIYPNVLLILPMALAYGVISPLMLFVAALYFVTTYIIYKEEFIYALGNNYETGGNYWDGVTNQIINSLYIFQCSTICTFLVNKKRLEIVFIAPLIVMTYMYKNALNTMFSKSIKYYPLNEQEEIYTDEFTSKVIIQRKQAVIDWDEVIDPADPDVIPCDELVKKTQKIVHIEYPYMGSSEGLENIMFPRNFFKKIEAIRKIDKEDKLEMFKPAKEPKEKEDKQE